MPEGTTMRHAPISPPPVAHRTDSSSTAAPMLRGDAHKVEKIYRANVGLKLEGDRVLDGNFVVEADVTLKGNLVVEGKLIIKNGGSLMVKGNITTGCILAGDILMKGERLASDRINVHTMAVKDVRVETREGTAVDISAVGSATISGMVRVAQRTWEGSEASGACGDLVAQGNIIAKEITAVNVFASAAGVTIVTQNGRKHVMIA